MRWTREQLSQMYALHNQDVKFYDRYDVSGTIGECEKIMAGNGSDGKKYI